MIKNWIRDFLGISTIESKIETGFNWSKESDKELQKQITALKGRVHNLDYDMQIIQRRDLNEIDHPPLPPEKPLVVTDKRTYQYLDNVEGEEYGWYAIWSTGFAGPFNEEKEACQYAQDNQIHFFNFWDIQKLYRHYMEKK